MHHLLLSLFILLLLFIVLGRYHYVEKSYALVCWIPIVLAAVAWFYERIIGFFMLPHAIWHLAFDLSYLLTMMGIALILRAFVRKRPLLVLTCATFSASLPIIAMMQLH